MRLEIRQTTEATRLKDRAIRHWKRLGGVLIVGAGLLGVMLMGCKPSGGNAAKPSGTNAVAGRPQVATKSNPPAGPLPRNIVRTNQFAAARPPVRSNAVPMALRPPPGRTNALAAGARTGIRTNAPAAAASAGTNAWSGMAGKLRHLPASPYFYPAATVAVLSVVFGVIFLVQFLKAKAKKGGETLPAEVAPKAAARPITKKARKAPIHSCNVLQVAADARYLWQFGSRGRGFVLSREQTSFGTEPLPAKAIAKDWRNLWQRKLNIAWLSPEQVFLRVAQFPVSDFEETLSMVELQLEKLSPMPVAQVVWSIQILPHVEGNLQTVIVMIAGRNAVEEFLGKLEGQGYMADRLEMPRLDQLRATTVTKDGAWIYPDPTSANPTALVAWWYGGVLQNLALITLSPTNRPASLKEQLLQMAWAGELEGWLTAPPSWHLVADPTVAAQWEPDLREALEQPVEVTAPPAPAALAAMTAQRVAQTEPQANLLPVEFATRYQQQFVDRLWMRGLGTVIALYLFGVMIYFAWLQFAEMGTSKVEQEVANLGPTYTNALQFKARYEVLKTQQDLKSAALDCWKAVAELLPDGVTLEGYNFNDGKRLSLNGTAPSDQAKRLTDFDSDIRKARLADGQQLFDPLAGEHLTYHSVGANLSWSCVLELKKGDTL
jgi:hypothetical protein